MPIGAAAGSILAPVAGAAVGSLFGGGGAKNAQPVLPQDLQGLRGQNIGLLQYLLGFQGQGQGQPQQMPQPQGGQLGGYQQQLPPGAGPGPQGLNPGSWGGYANPTGGQVPVSQGGPMQRWPGGQGSPGFAQQLAGGGGSQAASFFGDHNNWASKGGAQPNFAVSQTPNMDPNGGMSGGRQYSADPGMAGGAGGSNPLSRIESYFGPLGTPTTPLQQQSLGGISQFLNSNPYGQSNSALQQIMGGSGYNQSNDAFNKVGGQNYFGGAQQGFQGANQNFQNVGNANLFGGAQNAFNQLGQGNYYGDASDVFKGLAGYNPFGAAQGSLEGILGTNPGQGVLSALQPQFDRNLAAANQEGGRFGSANAILRSRAVDDYNLLGQQALQQGVTQQINAAGQLGAIGNSLIGARSAAGQGLLGVGQGQANQQQGAAQGLLGVGQGQLQQGLGAAQGQLGAAQGLLGVGQGQLNQGLGVAQGLGQNAANQGQQQLGAAQGLSQNANNYFNNLQGGYQMGSQQAQQEAQRQQQALSILQNLLGASFGATLGVPSQVNPTGAQTGAQIGGGIGGYLASLGQGTNGMIPPAPNWTPPQNVGIPDIYGSQSNVWGPASRYAL